jgi:hypothetical protein
VLVRKCVSVYQFLHQPKRVLFSYSIELSLIYELFMAGRIIYEDDYRRMRVIIDGKDMSIRVPISFNHLALMEYNPDLDLDVIVLFEKLLVFYRSNQLRTFNYQQYRLEEDLHIKRDRLTKARTFLIEAGILPNVVVGRGRKIPFSINIDGIIASIPKLYRLPIDESAKIIAIRELEIFFKHYLSKNYLNERIDTSIPDEVINGRISITRKSNPKIEKDDDKKDE